MKIIYTNFVPPTGGLGATDFVNIWIDNSLSPVERNIIEKHETAHCLLFHNIRYRAFLKKNPQADQGLFNVAADLEIARNIYTIDDEDIITRPRSKLKGGIISNSFPEIAEDILFAEDIYHLLPKSLLNTDRDMLADASGKSDEDEEMSSEEIKNAIEAAKDELDKLDRQRQQAESVSCLYKSLLTRQPSLSGEIDALLRVRAERVRSYKRPSRRANGDIFMKGAKTMPFPPKVEIFIDRSGSFCPEKTKAAEVILGQCLIRYSASIKNDVFYFGNEELRDRDIKQGGNTPYHLIASHLNLSRPKVAIIISDDDACEPAKLPKETTILCVPVGCKTTNVSTAFGGKDVFY